MGEYFFWYWLTHSCTVQSNPLCVSSQVLIEHSDIKWELIVNGVNVAQAVYSAVGLSLPMVSSMYYLLVPVYRKDNYT